MDIDKFPIYPKYLKLDKGDSDEHIDVENSVTTYPSVSGSNDNLSDVIGDSENEYSEENRSGDDLNVDSFKEKCLHELKNTLLLIKIIDKLYGSGDLNDFMTFLKLLSNGKLPHDNKLYIKPDTPINVYAWFTLMWIHSKRNVCMS